MIALLERFSSNALESGRICVAALNSRNLDYVRAASLHPADDLR